MPSPSARTSFQTGLLVAGIVLVALNLRPALAAVGPLVGAIRGDTGLSNTALGLLTTLPLLAFGLVSALTPLVTRRWGIEGALAGAMLLLAGGIALRSMPSVALLFTGTVLLGAAIAFGNVLLPSLVKRDFPARSGGMTSLYSSAMGLGATFGAGVSVPLAAAWGLGWRGSLASWALLALAAFVVWIPQLRRRTRTTTSRTLGASLKALGRSRLAWDVAVFMGLQSLTFYVVLAWLPELLQDRGLDADAAGWLLALSQAAGVLGTFVVPLWAARLNDQRRIIWVLSVLELASLIGLLLPSTALAGVWVFGIGFILGGTFGLALLLIVLRTANAEAATELSGMAQSVGYLIAATGPTLFGFLYDVAGGWTVPIGFLIAVLGGKVLTGLGAAKPGVLDS